MIELQIFYINILYEYFTQLSIFLEILVCDTLNASFMHMNYYNFYLSKIKYQMLVLFKLEIFLSIPRE